MNLTRTKPSYTLFNTGFADLLSLEIFEKIHRKILSSDLKGV